MIFSTPLLRGNLIRRYKRFLADIELDNGELVTAHCTNSGSMKTCIEENAPVYVSQASNPERKTKYTWEMIFMNQGWIGVNTLIPNHLAYEAMKNNSIPQLAHFSTVKREVRFEDSRLDLYADNEKEKCFVEVKNVTMKVGRFARFPDAVTTRGRKHLETLIRIKKQNIRAVMLYIIQRMDVDAFGVAEDIDPGYAQALKRAVNAGVEIIPMLAKVSPYEIKLDREIPFII